MERPPRDDQPNRDAPPGSDPPDPSTGSPAGGAGPEGRERSEPLIPEVLGPGEDDFRSGRGGGPSFGGPGRLFEPRSFAGGRVQVFGCSPGCLIISLVISVVLSLVLTLLLNAIF